MLHDITIISYTEGITSLSGNVCERDLGRRSGNFFIRKFGGLIFGVFFSFTWQIYLFIRIPSRKKRLFIRFSSWYRKFLPRIKIRIKKRICDVDGKNTPKIRPPNFRIKSFQIPCQVHFHRHFRIKKSPLPPVLSWDELVRTGPFKNLPRWKSVKATVITSL